MERAIIHLNIADFAAAVEINRMPSLKGYPLIIAPTGSPRALVYDMSDPAYKEGIRKGMSLARVRRINKKIKVIPPQFNRYEQVMKAIFKQALAYTPAIESGPWDGHLFLDVTGTHRLFGPPGDLAFRLKKQVKKTLGLDPIWSVATNKLVAKVATRFVKPSGEYIVAPGEERAFFERLPVALLPGLSKRERMKLSTFNLSYISQILPLTLAQLSVPFSSRAGQIHCLVRGIDTTPVAGTLEKEVPLHADHEFAEDTNDAGQLKKALYLLVETLCCSLRQRRRAADQLSLTLSYSDGHQQTAVKKLALPTANDMTLFKQAIPLLFRVWTRRIRIRHIRLVSRKPPQVQAALFSETPKQENQEKILTAMDKIRIKFGPHAIRAGLTLAEPLTEPLAAKR